MSGIKVVTKANFSDAVFGRFSNLKGQKSLKWTKLFTLFRRNDSIDGTTIFFELIQLMLGLCFHCFENTSTAIHYEKNNNKKGFEDLTFPITLFSEGWQFFFRNKMSSNQKKHPSQYGLSGRKQISALSTKRFRRKEKTSLVLIKTVKVFFG